MSLITYAVLGTLSLLGYALFFTFPLYKGAPYIPLNQNKINSLLNLIDKEFGLKNIKKSVDLGSGDGRIVVTLAQKVLPVTVLSRIKAYAKFQYLRLINLNLIIYVILLTRIFSRQMFQSTI